MAGTTTHITRGGIWSCKIGEALGANVPDGGDAPMRDAVARAFSRVTGEEPEFIFSGWSAKLTEGERACVEDRGPDWSKMTREVPFDVTDAMVERLRESLWSTWGAGRQTTDWPSRDDLRAALAAALYGGTIVDA